MKKTAAIALLLIGVMLVSATSSFAWNRGGGGVHHGGFRGHGVVIVGPGCCWGPWWGWGYYPPPYYYPQPQVIVQPAPVYVDSPGPAPESYWYYCPGTKAYYPNVQSCSEAWVKVPPRSE